MSADRWSACPNCKKIKEEKPSPYGKVSEEEYKQYLEDNEDDDWDETLREDFWQGTDEDGNYTVEYHGQCGECGFDFRYSHKINVFEAKDGE